MRPFELALARYHEFLSLRTERRIRKVGVLCSFAEERRFDTAGVYEFGKTKAWIELACKELDLEKPHVVGRRLASHPWLDEVLEVILESDLVVVEVSDPTQNVLYELGIATSLRAQESVLICSYRPDQIKSSEILQLQITWYDNYDELKAIIENSLRSSVHGLATEVDKYLKSVHERISPGAMQILISIQQWVWEALNSGKKVRWHMSYPMLFERTMLKVEGEDTERDFLLPKLTANELYVSELVDAKLARFDYDYHGSTWGWALHPTQLGRYYLASEHFCRRFNDAKLAIKISEALRNLVDTEG